MTKLEQVKWGQVAAGDTIIDPKTGAEDLVTGLHAITESVDGFKLRAGKFNKKSLTVSADHLILVKIPAIGDKGFRMHRHYNIPEALGILLNDVKTYKEANYHVSIEGVMTEEELLHRIQVGPPLENVSVDYLDEEDKLPSGLFWVPAWAIQHYSQLGVKFLSNNGKKLYINYAGLINARCVTTESSSYSINEITSHNSVAIRNIFFHAIQHGEDIKIAGIDLKLTEFAPWKNHKNVVGIANDIPTALEIMRLAREIMYKRNSQLADLGLINFTDFKPKHRDGFEYISGMKFKSRDMLEVEVNGKITSMPAAEAVDFILNNGE